MDDCYSDILWKLPEDEMYSIQYREDGTRWNSTNYYGTRQKMKAYIQDIPNYRDYRIVRISKYPPHPAQEVVLYVERKR